MDRSTILEAITSALSDIVDDEGLTLSEASSADDVPEWDSLNHVKLMVALETRFGLRFESSEISAPETVGDLIDLIQAKSRTLAP